MASSSVSGLNLPSGFKFLPTNRELLGYYLLNKVRGRPFKCDSRVMNEFSLYKTEPWDLWNRFGGPRLNQSEDLFIFTELKKVNDTGSNVCRTAGSGTWKGDTAATIVYDSDDKNKKILGSWKRFHFVSNEPNEDGSWIMVEYKLDDSLTPKSCSSDLVLCRIRKDRKRKLIEDQMNDSTQRSARRKVPRIDKHDVMSTHGKHILNDDSDLPAFSPQGLATTVEEQQTQPQQEFDSNKSFDEQELLQDLPAVLPSSSHFHEQQQHLFGNDLMRSSYHNIFEGAETSELIDIVLSNPNADISHQPNNLGIHPYFDEVMHQPACDDLMVSSHYDIYPHQPNNLGIHPYFDEVMHQPACDDLMVSSHYDIYPLKCDHESYVMSTYENKENNLLQQEVEHIVMCEGHHSSVSFEREEQKLQQVDQQLLPSTSHSHEKQQQLPGNNHYHETAAASSLSTSHSHEEKTFEAVNVQPNRDTLISYQPNHLSIPIESQFAYFMVDELGLVGTSNEPYTAAPDSVLDTPQPSQMQDNYAANAGNNIMRIDHQSHDQTQLGFPRDHSSTMKLSDSAAYDDALNFNILDDDVFNAIDFDNLR